MKDEYELSKDYQRLFDLISDGYRVVCYVDYDTRIEGAVLRDVCSVRLREDGSFGFGVRGLEYIGNYSSVLKGFDGFKDVCEQANVEFIDPDREKRLVEALEIGIDSLRRIKSGTYEEWAEGRADKAMRRLERLLAKHKGENGTSTN